MDFKIKCLFILLIIGVMTTSGCISSEDNNIITPTNTSINHYENKDVSFDIPSSWDMYLFLDPYAKFAFKQFSNENYSFMIMVPEDTDGDFESEKNILLDTVNSKNIISKKSFKANNASAYQVVTTDNSDVYTIDTIIIKNKKLFLIVITTDSAAYNATQKDLETIFNSFNIK